MQQEVETRREQPAGFIMVSDELMAYWTADGRSIEEIWRERDPRLTLSLVSTEVLAPLPSGAPMQ